MTNQDESRSGQPRVLDYQRKERGPSGCASMLLWCLPVLVGGWGLVILEETSWAPSCAEPLLKSLVLALAAAPNYLFNAVDIEHMFSNYAVPVLLYCLIFTIELVMLGLLARVVVRGIGGGLRRLRLRRR